MRHARRKRFLGAFYKRLSCAGDRKSQKENAYWKRHLNLAHGESPFSGFGLAVSGSFFLPPKIPNIFCKGFFFFSPVCAEGSAGAWPRPLPPRGRFGSYTPPRCPPPIVFGVL